MSRHAKVSCRLRGHLLLRNLIRNFVPTATSYLQLRSTPCYGNFPMEQRGVSRSRQWVRPGRENAHEHHRSDKKLRKLDAPLHPRDRRRFALQAPANARRPIFFFRSTFYRWTQLWPELCRDLRQAPKVLAVGDLHVGSFGTWRDAEGRMCWGVDDFDESYPLPYTNDLVRLAASVKIVVDAKSLTVKFKQGCDAILEGYREALRTGGRPFVLAEQQQTLEKLGIDAIEPPEDFWQKLNGRPGVAHGFPSTATRAIQKTLPAKKLPYKVVRREAGHVNLGQHRFGAIAQWCGAWISREPKAPIPSSCARLNGTVHHRQTDYETAIKSAVRSHDPYQKMVGGWLIRRPFSDRGRVN